MAVSTKEGKVYYCIDSTWKTLNGKDGVAGKDGENGKDDESCVVEKLNDKDGFKVICGVDSIGVVLNGADGNSTEVYYCGGFAYNMTTHFCQDEKVYPRCGSDKQDYDGHAYKCEDGKLFSLCDAFDKKTQACYDGKIYGKCGDELFDEALKMCENGEVVFPECGGEVYKPSAGEECRKGIIFAPCGEVMINTTTETCEPPSTIYVRDTRDNKLYKTVTIDKQVCIAENMNYESGNSFCYEDILSNCETYGRLYSWDSAQTACPAGYHLPNDAEWVVLYNFVLTDNNLGTTNEAGIFTDEGYFHKGDHCGFWSSTEVSGIDAAYIFILGYDNEGLDRGNSEKMLGMSVRCLRD